MAASLQQLSPITTAVTAGTSVAAGLLMLVSPSSTVGYQPVPTAGATGLPVPTLPPAFLFDYEGEQTVTLESDITDHYIEDNTAVQDQIALRPIVITTHGFIGELNDIAPLGLQSYVRGVQSAIGAIGAYAPQLTTAALNAYNEAFQLYQVAANAASTAVAAFSSLLGDNQTVIGEGGVTSRATFGTQNRQQTAFQQFYNYWSTRTPFNIQTPWAVFTGMYIQRLRAVQDAETNVVTDFEVTFKQVRTASLAGGASAGFGGQLAAQAADPANQGTGTTAPGPDLTGSVLPGMGVTP